MQRASAYGHTTAYFHWGATHIYTCAAYVNVGTSNTNALPADVDTASEYLW
jgi:hypothetical protein